jgi:DNA-3-methyladenine glycosylase
MNFVVGPDGRAAAVLIRALEPTVGLEEMRRRRGRDAETDLCSGPGKLGQALGIQLADDGRPLDRPPFAVLPRSGSWLDPEIVVGPRVGITKAADYPWRYCAAGNPHVSRPRPRSV